MPGLIHIFLILILSLGLSTFALANTLYFGKLTNPAHSGFSFISLANQSLKKAEGKLIKFGMTIPSRPVNQKYSLAFILEPAKKGSVLRKGRVVVTTKTRAEVRIILDIPGRIDRIEDKKGELIPLSFAKKGRAAGGRSTFQTIGRADVPVKAKLIIKDPSSKVLAAMQLEALGEWKDDSEGSNNPQTSVEKLSRTGKSCFFTEPGLLELTVSTGGFSSSVITILNEQDQPLHIKGYLQCISVKSSLSSFSLGENKGYFPHLVVIEPSELDLQPGEEGKINVICQVPQGEEERYYARVVLELDVPNEKEAGADIKRGATQELSAVSQEFKEVSSNLDEPLEFMIAFRRPGKVKLNPNSNRKIAAKNSPATLEEVTLERQVEFVFPEGIKDFKAAYDKRLPSGKYMAEVSFKHGNRMLISQSHTFCVE